MNVACDYEAPMQMLTTEKYIAPGTTARFAIKGELIQIQTETGMHWWRKWMESYF